MKYDDILHLILAKGGGGGGGGGTLIDKTITVNGTYNASDDNADGYEHVIVNVPANIVVSNENLLDNAWFTVNQKGNASGDFNVQTGIIDRWNTTYSSAKGSWSWSTSGITGTAPSGSGNKVFFKQAFEHPEYLNGKQLVASILLQNGTIYEGTALIRENGIWQYFIEASAGKPVNLAMDKYNNFVIEINPGNTVAIRAVKLELGATPTLAGDIAPDYPSELEKCQYYFERINANANFTLGVGLGNGTTLPFNVKIKPKRAACTITRSGSFKLGQDQASIDVTALAINTQSINSGDVQLTATASNTSGQLYRFIMVQGATLDFSAEL